MSEKVDYNTYVEMYERRIKAEAECKRLEKRLEEAENKMQKLQKALSLHHSMIIGGEVESETSEKMYKEAMEG